MRNKTITVFLSDDHTIVRQDQAKLLEGESDLRVVGEAKNGREAVGKVEEIGRQHCQKLYLKRYDLVSK